MKDTLHSIVIALVDEPENVAITEDEQDGVITFSLEVAKDDMGKIIGKDGKVIRAIRNVMKIKALKQNKKINISLVENPQE